MTDAPVLPDPSPRLEAEFRRVLAENMAGLPFVNPVIRVEAIAFAPWKHYWLGVMLTPWAMNLMLTPREMTRWRPLPAGEKRRYVFPAGRFDFISAQSPAIGAYLICSLYSPVLQFADHATARDTARYARAALFEAAEDEAPAVEARPAAAVSRRDLLHGRLRSHADEPRG